MSFSLFHRMNITPALNGSLNHQDLRLIDSLALTVTSVSVNLFLGTPLNGYVMWLILRGSRESITADFYFLNLALSQFIFSLSCIWYVIYINLQIVFFVLIFASSMGLLFTTNPLLQLCICMESYLGVVHPVLFLRFKPLRYKLACCCATWVISLASCGFYFFTYINPLILYGNSSFCMLIFCVMLFCCFSVLRALKRPGPGERGSGKKISNAKKRKAFRIIVMIMISMAINLLCYIASVPAQCCFKLIEFRQILEVCLNIAIITAFIQPLIYLHKSGNLFCVKKV